METLVENPNKFFKVKQTFSPVVLGKQLLISIVTTVQSILINRAIDQTSYWTAMLWISLLSVVFSFIFLYPKFKDDLKHTKPKKYLGVALLAVVGGIGDLSAFKAFENNVGLSSVIISLPISMIAVFLLSIWKPSLLEKHTVKVYLIRFIAAAIMLWGALQLK